MSIEVEVREEEKDLKKIFNMFREKKFDGDTGQAIKNSTYQLTTNLIVKIGSLLFTFIIARLLQPERMGLYNLALSTILLFAIFSDLGIGSALITYTSKMLGKGNLAKAKGYTKKLLYWKSWLIALSSLILLLGAYFISEFYYQKPIFYAVLAGLLYIPTLQLMTFIQILFMAENNFKTPMMKEIIFQIVRLAIVPASILLLIHSNLSDKVLIMLVLLSITACQLITLLYLGVKARIEISFLKVKAKMPNKKESKDLKRFIIPLTATALAGTAFGYIDTLMLGRYVATEFIAYYGSAFALIGSAGAVIGFMASAMTPIFSRGEGVQLEKMFKKARNFTFIISGLAAIFTYIFAWWIIRIAYGSGYLIAVPVLKAFSVLLIFSTMIGLYSSYFVSQKKTKIVSALLIVSTILNIVLNIIGITYGLKIAGDIGGVYGAVIATILSRVIYLAGFMWWKNKTDK